MKGVVGENNVRSETDSRLVQLNQWVDQALGIEATLVPMQGDAGGRRYFNIEQKPGWLAVDAPPETEKVKQFLYLSGIFGRHGVPVPSIVATEAEKGFLLVENLGEGLFSKHVNAETAPVIYGEALLTQLAMAQIPLEGVSVPLFDREFILQELGIFREWFVQQMLGVKLGVEDIKVLDTVFELLAREALQQPFVFMHRDYHSRNILLVNGKSVVIDYQDAVVGPLTYDLASLLKDAYLRLPPEDVQRWALVYGDMAREAGLLTDVSVDSFIRSFDLMGLQRHLKILGIFARLHLRDQKSGYLHDLPRVIGYVQEVCARYPELSVFKGWFEKVVLPTCRTQAWYSEDELYVTAYYAGEHP